MAIDKRVTSAAEAVADIPDGASLGIGGDLAARMRSAVLVLGRQDA